MDMTLYAWEGIACIAVMMIHCLLPGELGAVARAMARFAVPLFFAISGKFLVLQWETTSATREKTVLRTILGKRIRRTLRTTLFVTAVYTIYSAAWHLFHSETPRDWFLMKFPPVAWLRLLFFNTGTVLYDGSIAYDHLWYLFALLYVLILLYLYGMYLLPRAQVLAPVTLLVMYAALHAQRRYHFYIGGLYSGDWYLLRNWLFFGLPFVLLGAMLAQKSLGQKSRWLILAGFVLTFLEYRRFGTMEVYVGSLLVVIGILTASETLTGYFVSLLTDIGQHLSRHVYYWHMLVYSVLIQILALLPGNLHAKAATGWLLPIGTYLLTLLLSALLTRKRNA